VPEVAFISGHRDARMFSTCSRWCSRTMLSSQKASTSNGVARRSSTSHWGPLLKVLNSIEETHLKTMSIFVGEGSAQVDLAETCILGLSISR
jgi:hypothetical protein